MDWPLLLVFVVACELVGASGSFFTVRAIPGWYAALKKPSFNPPNWIFGPVWTVLYALQGAAAYFVFQANGTGVALSVFVGQLILNAAWTPIFFGAKRFGAAFAEIVVLFLLIIMAMVLFFGISVLAGWLMVPYLLWVAFAATLNYRIWRLNPAISLQRR